MRELGALAAPVVTYLTDASVHPLWVHPAVDLHLGLHDVAVAAARALGGRATEIAPLVPDTYLTGPAWSTRPGSPCGRPWVSTRTSGWCCWSEGRSASATC